MKINFSIVQDDTSFLKFTEINIFFKNFNIKRNWTYTTISEVKILF